MKSVTLSLLAALLGCVTLPCTQVTVAAEPAPAAPAAAQDRERPRGEEGATRERMAAKERQLAELERMINEAREQGQEERLQALEREADEIRRQMRDQGRDERGQPREERSNEERMREMPGERQLAELEQMINEARERGEEERMQALGREADEIRQRLRGRGRDERERPREERPREMREEAERLEMQARELEERRRGLEMERAELAASFGRLELVGRIAQISESDQTAAAFAVMHVERFMELPQAVDFLQEMLEQSQNEAVRRMIRIRLIELNAGLDRRDGVREQLKHLILGE